MRIKYNAPVSLTIAIIASLLVLVDEVAGLHLIPTYFMGAGERDVRHGQSPGLGQSVYTYSGTFPAGSIC